MFRHIVLLHLDEATAPDDLDALLDGLAGLPGRIPAIRSYEFGRDAGLAEGNATVGIVATFDDRAGYEEYRDHPAHQEVIARLIRPHLASRAAIQHEL
jgi:hypothetical protein